MRQLATRQIFFVPLFVLLAHGCSTAAPGSPASGGRPGAVSAGSAGAAGSAAGSAIAGAPDAETAGVGAVVGGAGGSSGGASGAGNGGIAAAAGGPASAGSGATGGGGLCVGLFCEDFESGVIDASKWDTKTMGGSVALQSTRVAHGQYAVQFHGRALADVSSDYAFLIAHDGPAALATHHFGRAYFYITPKPTSGHTGMVFGGTSGFPKPAYLEVANINSGWQLGYVKLNGPPNGEEASYPPGQVPVEKWTCLEWELNDQPDSVTLWVDGVELGKLDDRHIDYPAGHVPGSPMFDGMSSNLVGGFSDFGFGFYDWHPKNAFDLFYDDIVLDVKRVGCLPP